MIGFFYDFLVSTPSKSGQLRSRGMGLTGDISEHPPSLEVTTTTSSISNPEKIERILDKLFRAKNMPNLNVKNKIGTNFHHSLQLTASAKPYRV